MTAVSLDISNIPSRQRIEIVATASRARLEHTLDMPNDRPDWYLKDWMKHFGKIQADLSKEVGWDRSRANFLFHSKQAFKRHDVNDIAEWLNLEPFELLIPPARALAIRELYKNAQRIVQSQAEAGLNPDGERFLPKSEIGGTIRRRSGTNG